MGKPAATDRPRLTPLSHSFTLDCNVYVRSQRAGQRVMTSITSFITRRLQLKVNESKSAVARPPGPIQTPARPTVDFCPRLKPLAVYAHRSPLGTSLRCPTIAALGSTEPNHFRYPRRLRYLVKQESGGLLLLRRITPLARRNAVYFCSGAYRLARCRYHGADGMRRWVGMGVIADNLINMGRWLVSQPA